MIILKARYIKNRIMRMLVSDMLMICEAGCASGLPGGISASEQHQLSPPPDDCFLYFSRERESFPKARCVIAALFKYISMKLKVGILICAISESCSFQVTPIRVPLRTSSQTTQLFAANKMSTDELKIELTKYLEKRKALNADESAKLEVGKVVGGTKGNAVLDFISGAPVKERVIEDIPDVFDYTELEKYGCGYLVEPIMDNGGRVQMYALMNMTVPPPKDRIKPKVVPKLVIDRKGENDQARYTGLKVNQLLDDDEFGRKLEEAQRKSKEGKSLRPKLMEEDFEVPFKDRRNTSPMQTPDWTPERLDEEGRRAGMAASWARKARAGEFKNDPFELLSVTGRIQLYSIITSLWTAFAFGNSTRAMLNILNISSSDADSLLNLAQGPALVFLISSLGSSVACGFFVAPKKNRSAFTWFIKGWAGGPLSLLQLKDLDSLKTRGEIDSLGRT